MMRRIAVVSGAALVAVAMISPASAAAEPPPTSPYSDGNERGITIRGLKLSGDVGSPDTAYWRGPPCWRAPWLSGPAMASRVEGVHNRTGGPRDGGGSGAGLPDDIAKHKDEEGQWWKPASNGTSAGVACESGMEPPVIWVGEGQPAPPGAITPAILAQIARAHLDLPAPKVTMNPQPPRRSYVGMGTWVWAQPVQRQLQVTAALPELNMSATVTAARGDLAIKPGTADPGRYRLHPCAGLGKPFPADAPRRVAEQDPPCGVTYLRASSDQPGREYTLTAELTWNVNWQGSDGNGGPMDAATFGDTVQVPVGEVQTNVRD